MGISQEVRSKIETELREISDLELAITNKISAFNSYYAKVLQKDAEDKEKEKRATLPRQDTDKGSTAKINGKKPGNPKSVRKSSTPKKKRAKGR